jgi:hypothetical protein
MIISIYKRERVTKRVGERGRYIYIYREREREREEGERGRKREKEGERSRQTNREGACNEVCCTVRSHHSVKGNLEIRIFGSDELVVLLPLTRVTLHQCRRATRETREHFSNSED